MFPIQAPSSCFSTATKHVLGIHAVGSSHTIGGPFSPFRVRNTWEKKYFKDAFQLKSLQNVHVHEPKHGNHSSPQTRLLPSFYLPLHPPSSPPLPVSTSLFSSLSKVSSVLTQPPPPPLSSPRRHATPERRCTKHPSLIRRLLSTRTGIKEDCAEMWARGAFTHTMHMPLGLFFCIHTHTHADTRP